uniref:Uncharacterized protein n=1 Tax=Sphaerodactylus townsendi TaxID=933632 RepID=A0ACB8FPM3_9SAUR
MASGGGGGGACWVLLLATLAATAPKAGAPFPGPISNLAVSGRRVLVSSGPCVYQLQPTRDAAPAASAGPPLFCLNRTDSVNQLLLPYAAREGARLITCWTQPNGVCYRGDLRGRFPENKLAEQAVSCSPRGSSVGTLFPWGPDWFLAVAATTAKGAADSCASGENSALYIVRDDETRVGEESSLRVPGDGYFVDAFRWAQWLFFPYYNLASCPPQMLIVPEDPQPSRYQQAPLRCADKTRLLSSSRLSLPGGRALWVGVFSSGEALRTPTSSALCLFDLRQVLDRSQGCRRGFPGTLECCNTTQPVNSPFLNHSDLVSVYATVILKTPVLFLRTGNGQLLKVTLDEKMRPSCPDILYEIEEETSIFNKLEFDPLDKNFIYLSSNEQLWRVQVANCSKYVSCKECLSAMDPYCGWCHLNKRCTLKEECPANLKNWVDISEGADKCLKIYISGTYRGVITVTSVGNFSDLSKRDSSCKVVNAQTDKTLCENKSQDTRSCSCSLHSEAVTDKGIELQ